MASVDALINKRRSRSEPPAGYKYANSESTPSIYYMKRKPYLVSKVDITQVQDFLVDVVQILKSQEGNMGMYKETPRISCFCWPTYGGGKDPPPSVHHPLSKYFCSTNMCNIYRPSTPQVSSYGGTPLKIRGLELWGDPPEIKDGPLKDMCVASCSPRTN